MESNMEALLNEIKNMTPEERYKYRVYINRITALLEEKEVIHLNTNASGKISQSDWNVIRPYQIYICNQHKVVLTDYGCYLCVDIIKRNKEKLDKEIEEETTKNLQELFD